MKITALIQLMLMLLLIGILALASSIQRANGAEPPATEWTKAYGGANSEVARSVIQTSDGGYLLAGETASFGVGGKDFWLAKTDASGNMEWNNTYGGASNDMSFSVVEAGDGGYVLTGRTNSFGAGIADFWLVKVDSSGNHEWNKTYGGSGVDAARCVINTDDGGYVLAGFTQSFGAGGQDFWLVKVDSSGGQEWNKTYGGAGTENAFSVVKTGDGGYALAGRTRSFGEGRLDFWLVKVDSSGGQEWNKTYGGAGNDPAHSMVEANLVKTGDGGYVLAGFTQSFGAGGQDGWLIKTDASGNMEWNNTYGGVGDDVLNSVVTSSDGGYVLAGFTQSFGAGGQDFWLVKIAGPPKYPLSIQCSPIEVTFTIDSVSHITPWCETYEEGTTVDLVMPETYTVGQARSYWSQWSDGNTSRLRTVTINTNITLTAYYTGPYYKLTIVSSPITGIAFTVNGAAQTTPYTKWLLEGSYTLEMPETHNGYVWSHWLKDGDTNRIKTVTLPATTYTAVYTTAPVGGTTVSIESRHLNPCITSIFIIVSIVSISGIYLGRRYTRK